MSGEHVRDQRLSLIMMMYSALIFAILETLLRGVLFMNVESRSQSLVWSFGSLRGQRSLSGLCCFPLGAFCFGLGSICLPGAFRRTADGGRGGRRFCRLQVDVLNLVVRPLQLVMLQTAQLSCGGPGAQCPLLVSLAEGVGAELAESLRVFPADVTVVPGAVPAACGERGIDTKFRICQD